MRGKITVGISPNLCAIISFLLLLKIADIPGLSGCADS